MTLQFKSVSMVLAVVVLVGTSFCPGQIPETPPAPSPEGGRESEPQSSSGPIRTAPAVEQHPGERISGSITGSVVDQSGAVVAGARVKLTRESSADEKPLDDSQSLKEETLTGGDGQFSFANIAPGPFHLIVTAARFETQTSSGTLHPGEMYTSPPIALAVATNISEVQVSLTQVEVAEQQIKLEEKQRVFGALPNFYVSYISDAAPLTSKQKFKLAGKTMIDPFTLVAVGGAAGIEQAQNHFIEYGQGAQGYGKRFGAGYADTAAGTFIGAAILPSLLKQDPRYFYKGSGSKPSRFFYAIAGSFICKGDNRRWQANYSNVLGSLAAGGISNLYYPAQDRGAELTFENGALGLGATAVANVLQEFLIRHLTPKIPANDPAKP